MNENFLPSNFTKTFITGYVNDQLNHFFPDQQDVKADLVQIIDVALDRFSFSMKHVKIATHQRFTHLHSDLYAQLLYYISNTAWQQQKMVLAQKAYYLNKSLHALNCMYNTQLPDVFLFFHIVGTVLGKATYADFLVVNQGVTVGTNKEIAPVIEKAVMLRPNSSVIGNSRIGAFSSLSANAMVLDTEVPPHSIVIGSKPELIIKTAKRSLIKEEIFFGLE